MVLSSVACNVSRYHMERCIASGLWIADASTLKDEEKEAAAAAKGDGNDSESKEKPECSSAGKSGEGTSSCGSSSKD